MDREGLDWDPPLELDLGEVDDLPPLGIDPPREPAPRLPVEPATPMFTWAMLAVILGLGAVKIALFLLADAGAAVATFVVGALFVAAHGAIILVAGAWFDRHRRG